MTIIYKTREAAIDVVDEEKSVGVRELRQNASAVLRDVKAGETVTVTEHGRPVARIVPYKMSPLEQAIANGEVRLPTKPTHSFKVPSPKPDGPSSAEILADVRGYDRLY